MQSTLGLAERISRISVSSTMKVAADADKLRREGADVVDFGAGEPDFPTPENIKRAAIDAIHTNFTKYTPTARRRRTPAGHLRPACRRVRDKVQARGVRGHGGRKARDLQPGAGAGGSRRRGHHPGALLGDLQGRRELRRGECVFIETDEHAGFNLTAEMVERHLTPRTKMIIINSPSNPSGTIIDQGEFEKIFRLTVDRGIWLMTDECYCNFLYEGHPFSISSLAGAKETSSWPARSPRLTR